MARRARRHRNIVNPLQPGLGVYEFWRFGDGRDFAFPAPEGAAKYLTALAELELIDGPVRRSPPARGVSIWVPTLWKPASPAKPPFRPRFVPFVLARPDRGLNNWDSPAELHRRLLRGVSQTGFRRFAESVDLRKAQFRVGLPVKRAAMRECVPSSPHWQPDLALLGRGKLKGRQISGAGERRITIFAIIDDGLPFAHRNFRCSNGKRTRVEFCWLQSAKADRRHSVLFGREYTREDIEALIASHGDDEDALYRAAGATDDTEGLASMLARHTTHGAHVMDLATGYAEERSEEPVEEIRIVAVQLPNLLTMDTSGVGKDMYLLSAFHYIFDRAERIARGYDIARARLVVNFSYGYFGGSHDGRIDVEAAIGELIHARRRLSGPTALVVPAGNSFLERMHARIAEDQLAGGETRLRWRLQPADRTPNYVELWFPEAFDPVGYTIAMHDPSDLPRGSLPFGSAGKAATGRNGRDARSRSAKIFDDNHVVGLISADYHRCKRWRVLITTAPSEPGNGKHRGITPGAWMIVIKRNATAAPLPEPIHCWIQRDTDPESFRSGARQSYFDDPLDMRIDKDGSLREDDTAGALVRRFGSLNALGTANASITVAGFRLEAGLGSSMAQGRPARYSGAGMQNGELPEARIDCGSMSDRLLCLPGTVAAGVHSGSRSILQGTSVAAPFVARQLVTTFTTASDEDVERAERDNYLPLLRGHRVAAGDLRVRLGEVLVAPHWQPEIDASLLARDEEESSASSISVPASGNRKRRAGLLQRARD
ncbi:hypothetical protein [Bradyrhizobium sp. BR 10289]|uniref:hypothetical protein n=1 Tax=Bradyrhizobium sp. BR 10289 TaxID=2749993 RepID=UPI001C651525|nr:hypothetical protein [Bradyrhizobium sp. BR 10289]MBW7971193.1 hypothetical protein [Bradyrhizobium sp. BR 10289]